MARYDRLFSLLPQGRNPLLVALAVVAGAGLVSTPWRARWSRRRTPSARWWPDWVRLVYISVRLSAMTETEDGDILAAACVAEE